MKEKLLFICSLLLALNTFSQKPETFEKLASYEYGVNVIVISTSDSIELAFNKIAMILMDYGFGIENSDRALFYLNTELSSVGKYSFDSKISLRLKTQNDTTRIIIKGDAYSGGFKFRGANMQKKKQVPGICFAQMFEVAELYGNGIISVEKD